MLEPKITNKSYVGIAMHDVGIGVSKQPTLYLEQPSVVKGLFFSQTIHVAGILTIGPYGYIYLPSSTISVCVPWSGHMEPGRHGHKVSRSTIDVACECKETILSSSSSGTESKYLFRFLLSLLLLLPSTHLWKDIDSSSRRRKKKGEIRISPYWTKKVRGQLAHS